MSARTPRSVPGNGDLTRIHSFDATGHRCVLSRQASRSMHLRSLRPYCGGVRPRVREAASVLVEQYGDQVRLAHRVLPPRSADTSGSSWRIPSSSGRCAARARHVPHQPSPCQAGSHAEATPSSGCRWRWCGSQRRHIRLDGPHEVDRRPPHGAPAEGEASAPSGWRVPEALGEVPWRPSSLRATAAERLVRRQGVGFPLGRGRTTAQSCCTSIRSPVNCCAPWAP